MTNLIGDYLYNSLPALYRVQDKDTNYTLKRYLGALGQSMTLVNDETRDILTLLDVEKMDAKFLPYFASMFGVEYHHDIPEDSQRKYLANIVDIQKRKGTKEVLEFTARELTGMNATIREGHNLKFKTWGKPLNSDKCSEYESPRTFGAKSGVSYFFLGGENTQRFTVMVYLDSIGNTNPEIIFLNTQLLSRWTKDLVQPYINLRYKATGITYSDEGLVSDITEWDSVRVIDKSTRKARVVESEVYSRVRSTEGLTYSNNLVSKPLDRLKLLQDILDGNVNEVTEVGVDTMRIVNRVHDNINLDVDYVDSDTIMDIHNTRLTSKVTETEKLRMKDSDIKELEHLEEPVVDYIHSNIISDIMNLGDRIESSFEDTITQITNE